MADQDLAESNSYELNERDPARRNDSSGHPNEINAASEHVGSEAGASGQDEAQGGIVQQDCGRRFPVERVLFETGLREHGQWSRFDNPFLTWDLEDVRNVGRRIACEYGKDEDSELFVRAALILARPDEFDWDDFETFPEFVGLTNNERRALRREHSPDNNFWRQPWTLKITYLMLFIAATVQGWTQTATNGANLGWPEDLGLDFDVCSTKAAASWIYGGVNAAPYLASSLGCWFSDPLNEFFYGRRGAIVVSALFIFCSAIGGSLVQTPGQLLGTRALLGLGMGCKAAVVPVFAAEIAPAHLRGRMVMNWQVFDALGIFLGFSANLIASTTGKSVPESAWRWQIASSAIPAFILLWSLVYVCWDSPRYLMKHEKKYRRMYDELHGLIDDEDQPDNSQPSNGQVQNETISENQGHAESEHQNSASLPRQALDFVKEELKAFKRDPSLPYKSPAFETFLFLRQEPILAAKELIYAHCQLLVETFHTRNQNPDGTIDFSLESDIEKPWLYWRRRLWSLFYRSYTRREIYAAAVVMISQQLCGINVLIFYSSSLFCSIGDRSANTALWLTWGLGLTNFVAAYPAYKLIDSRGRRWLLLNTLIPMATTMAIAAGGAKLSGDNAQKIVVGVFTYVFTIFYSFGMGPVPFTYSAEIFPLEQRMVGMSLAVSLNFLGAGLLTLFVPRATDPAILLGVFSFLNVVAWLLIWVYVREVASNPTDFDEPFSSALSLEELHNIFRLSTKVHFSWLCKEVWPFYRTHPGWLWKQLGNAVPSRPPRQPRQSQDGASSAATAQQDGPRAEDLGGAPRASTTGDLENNNNNVRRRMHNHIEPLHTWGEREEEENERRRTQILADREARRALRRS